MFLGFFFSEKSVYFYFKGALTNKVYSFNLRAWGVEMRKTKNIFDSFEDTVSVSFQGTKIQRILSHHYYFSNFKWITDKIRFFFDSLYIQRTLNVVKKTDKNNTNLKLSWRYFLSFLSYFFFKIKQNTFKIALLKSSFLFSFSFLSKLNKFTFLFTPTFSSDILDFCSFNKLQKIIGEGFIDKDKQALNSFTSNIICEDFLSFKNKFLNNQFVNNVILLLVGLDLRFELPKLYLLLRSKINKYKNIFVYSFGVRLYYMFKFKVYHLACSLKDFVFLLQGRFWLNNTLCQNLTNNTNFMLLGSEAYNFLKIKQLFFALFKFTKNYNVQNFIIYSWSLFYNRNLFNFRYKYGLDLQKRHVTQVLANKFGFYLDSFYLNNPFYPLNFLKKNFIFLNLNAFLKNLETSFYNFELPVANFLERSSLSLNNQNSIAEMFKIINKQPSIFGIIEQKSLFDMFVSLISLLLAKKKFSFGKRSFIFKRTRTLKKNLISTNRVYFSISKTIFVKQFGMKFNKSIIENFCLLNLNICRRLNVILQIFVPNYYKNEEYSKHSIALNLAGVLIDQKNSAFSLFL